MTDSSADAARLARALFPLALQAFRAVPPADRAPALLALDAFLAAPAPSRFLAAARELRQLRSRTLIQRDAGGTLQRARDHALASLRDIPGIPGEILTRLEADLPADVRSGPRLRALVDLARSYHELATRVAADTIEMRRRLRQAHPRLQSRKRNPS